MSPDRTPVRLRIVSLNTWKNEGLFKARLRVMTEGLRALAPHVACLQECFAAPQIQIDVAGMLAAKLGLAATCAPAREKTRTHGGEPVLSTSGLAILGRKLGGAETITLSDHPSDRDRIAQRARLPNGLSVANVHLSHLRGEEGARLRRRQLDEIMAWMTGAEPFVICGDFNAPADAPELGALFDRPDIDRGPRAAADAATFQGERPGDSTPRSAIDHVVLVGGGGWRVVEVGRGLADPDPVEGVFPSDHAAVVVDLVREG